MERALETVCDFWSTSGRPVASDQPPILVELFHENTEYLLRALTVAKFAQQVSGAPLIAIHGVPGILEPLIGSRLKRSENVRLANAFGVTRVIDAPNDDVSDDYEPEAQAAVARISALAPGGHALPPAAIVDLRAVRTTSGFPIGRVLQETFMRGEVLPTLLAGARLSYWSKKVFGFHAFANGLLSSLRPSAFVTGHIDYCPWGAFGGASRPGWWLRSLVSHRMQASYSSAWPVLTRIRPSTA